MELLRICLSGQEFNEEAQIILDKVISEADRVDTSEFRTILLPFLKQLISVLRAQPTPLDEPRYQSLYQSVLSSYTKRCVGMRHSRPRDWRRAPVSCACGDCLLHNNFLQNPTERVGRFPMAKHRRQYLHNKLDNTGRTHVTERRGSPHTLVVTKTERAYEKDLAGWQKRVQEAHQQIMTLGNKNLEMLLGDRYEEIPSLFKPSCTKLEQRVFVERRESRPPRLLILRAMSRMLSFPAIQNVLLVYG